MTADRSPKGTVQIALRISPELRERIKLEADENNRSVNSELTATLEERYPPPVDPEFDKLFEAVHRKLESRHSNDAKALKAQKAKVGQLRAEILRGDASKLSEAVRQLVEMLLVDETKPR